MKQRWIAILVLAAACGGGSGGGGGTVNSGLPPDEKLSELDDASLQKICQAFDDGYNSAITPSDSVRVECTGTAIESSASNVNGEIVVDVQKCQQMADACVANPPQNVTDDSAAPDLDCTTAMQNSNLQNCGATVHEFEACVNAMISEVENLRAMLTCANGKMLLSSDQDINFASLPECKSLQTDCPNFPLMVTSP